MMNGKVIDGVLKALGVASSDFNGFYSLTLTIDSYVIVGANDAAPERTLARLSNNRLFRNYLF